MGFKALDWAGRRKVRGSGRKAGLSQTAAVNASRSRLHDESRIGLIKIARGYFDPPAPITVTRCYRETRSPIKVTRRDFDRASSDSNGGVR